MATSKWDNTFLGGRGNNFTQTEGENLNLEAAAQAMCRALLTLAGQCKQAAQLNPANAAGGVKLLATDAKIQSISSGKGLDKTVTETSNPDLATDMKQTFFSGRNAVSQADNAAHSDERSWMLNR